MRSTEAFVVGLVVGACLVIVARVLVSIFGVTQ